MITDLDKTLEQLLIKEMPIENSEVDIQFDLPNREWATRLSRPTTNLYLYDIRENIELRRNDWIVERDDNGRATKKWPPRRIDLAYLVTAWTSAIEDEHHLLWRALWALFRHPELPEEVLQGSLQEATVPIPTSIAQPDRIPNMGDLWGVLDNEIKPSLHYVVTLPLDLARAITSPLVITKRIRTEQGIAGQGPFQETAQIAGTVRDAGGQPIAGATVSLREKGIATQTDEDGRYTFSHLPEGRYAFAVSAPGRPSREYEVSVLSEKYDLTV